MYRFPCNISIESWNGDRFLYKDNLELCSARNMRASCRMSAPVMVIVMKEKFLCLISRVFCIVLRIENLFIRLTRRDNMPHITVISSFHLLLWIYQTFILKQLPVMWQWRQKLSLSHPSLYRESLISTFSVSFLLVLCTMLWCHVTERPVSRLHSGTTRRGLSSDALCGELPPNIVTVRHWVERSA